jgi:ribonuclease T2
MSNNISGGLAHEVPEDFIRAPTESQYAILLWEGLSPISTFSISILAMFGIIFSSFVSAEGKSTTCEIKDEWINKNYDSPIDYQNTDVKTDFFVLIYSNAKDFCEKKRQTGQDKDFPLQCGSSNNFGWVLHGLWGESTAAYLSNNTKGHPRFCKGDLGPVPLAELKPYLCRALRNNMYC